MATDIQQEEGVHKDTGPTSAVDEDCVVVSAITVQISNGNVVTINFYPFTDRRTWFHGRPFEHATCQLELVLPKWTSFTDTIVRVALVGRVRE